MKSRNLPITGIALLIIISLFSFLSCGEKKSEKKVESESKAIQDLTKMILESPDDPDLYYDRAILYYENSAFDEAIDDITRAQKIDSLRPDLYHLLADVYLDYYKSFDALKTMEKVVSIHPTRIPSLLKLAEFQYILKQYNFPPWKN